MISPRPTYAVYSKSRGFKDVKNYFYTNLLVVGGSGPWSRRGDQGGVVEVELYGVIELVVDTGQPKIWWNIPKNGGVWASETSTFWI